MIHDREDRPADAHEVDAEPWPDGWELADVEAGEDLAEGLKDVALVAPDPAVIAAAADHVRRAHARGDAAVVWAVAAPDDLDDRDLLQHLVAATMSLDGDIDDDAAGVVAALEVLEPADWVGVVLGLATSGVGADADAATLADLADPDVDDDEPLHPDDRALLEQALATAGRVLEAAGAFEPTARGPRLTQLGAWLLPTVATSVWPLLAEADRADVPGAEPSVPDEPVASSADRVEGRVFTHRLSPDEVDHGALRVDADLALLAASAPLQLPDDASLVDERRGDATWLVGPDAWLPEGSAAGTLLALRVDDGRLEVAPIDDDALDAAAGELAAAHLREVFDAAAVGGTTDGTQDLVAVIAATLQRFPAALRRPVAPVGALLADAGLEVAGGRVVAADHVEEVVDDTTLDVVARHHGLDVQATKALRTLSRLAARVATDAPEVLSQADAREGLQALTDLPTVPVAFADASLGIVGAGADLLDRLVALLRPAVRGRGSAALDLLTARAAEARGETRAAESALRRVLEADPDLTAAHEDLAWYLELRGDARGALGHLRLAGVPDDDTVVRRLEVWIARTASAGRNDPCPCGSGAKYKRCCERTGGPLHDRADWLIDKVVSYARQPLQRAVLLPLVEARAGDATDRRRLIAAMRDPLVLDAALFDHGLLRRFLADRGTLLPADERELVTGWLDAPRTLYEVVEVDRRRGMRVRDVRTSREVELSVRAGPSHLAVGELGLGRLLFTGRDHVFAPGLVPVEPVQRDGLLALLDTDPPGSVICAWAAAQEAVAAADEQAATADGDAAPDGGPLDGGPPDAAGGGSLRLRTIDGAALVTGTVEYRVADPDQAAAALQRRFDADPRGSLFVEVFDVDGGSWTRATLSLDGDRLTVTSNADDRFEHVAAVIDEVVVGAEQVASSRHGAAGLVATPGAHVGTLGAGPA